MAAIIRLKRRLCDEPLEALVINCKKPKLDTDNSTETESELKTVLKFAGTIKEQVSLYNITLKNFKHLTFLTKKNTMR